MTLGVLFSLGSTRTAPGRFPYLLLDVEVQKTYDNDRIVVVDSLVIVLNCQDVLTVWHVQQQRLC